MDELSLSSSHVYTDIQSLKGLQYNANSDAVKKEVSQQFEAILMQMVMSSMRSANKAFASDGAISSSMDMYQDLFDKQLSLMMSNSHLGFAEMVEKNIDQTRGISPEKHIENSIPIRAETPLAAIPPAVTSIDVPSNEAITAIDDSHDASNKKGVFSTPEEFVKKMWSSAKVAAKLIGATPEILIAQAALETNWGKNIIPTDKNASSFNLFNIKADSAWTNKTTTIDSLEQRNGVLVKEKSHFRSYGSYIESFMDYVSFLKQNSRYSDTLSKAADPEKFVTGLQNAGYATDTSYAEKILKIFSSRSFQGQIAKLKSIT